MQSGWILDVYPVSGGMCVWVVDAEGRAQPWIDEWAPRFYLSFRSRLGDIHLEDVRAEIAQQLLSPFKTPLHLQATQKKEFFSNETISVLEVRLTNPLFYSRFMEKLAVNPDVLLFNADLNLGQLYFYERNLFPLARVSFEADQEGRVRSWNLEDSPWTLDYPLPPLRTAHLGIETNADPNHRRHGNRGRFLLTYGKNLGEGTTYVMDGSEKELLLSLNRRMADWDPDILLTDWGDSYLMPRLQIYSDRTGVPLRFSRDPEKFIRSAQERSYFSYGKMIFKAGSRTLFGRLHIDTENSFTVRHTELDGLFEIARVAKIPIQRAARCTIGTSLSSMQLNWAIQNNYLIPLDKGQTEDFRPAEDLIAADRGGLVYEPEIGWHEDLIEFDFVSMYPEIMIRHNVTPEAVNCACCPDNKVPEINHHLCRRRIGMVPAVLKPIVEKRAQYKELIKEGHPKSDIFQKRREAFKWALVTCFGYLGFRNARFGRIEAHECVNAYSREVLLKAKEVAEAEGYHFLHAIVDSLWLKKPGATAEEVEALRKKIEDATGLPLGYEGRYRWIRFCPSRMNARVGVPNRYFGAFSTGQLKIRGIELRRHDTPLFIKDLQQKLLDRMATARNLGELKSLKGDLAAMVEDAEDRIQNGQVSPLDLAVSVHLRQEPERYQHDTLSAIAAKKLAACGVKLHPGETIQYVVMEEHDKVKDWRVMPLALITETFEYDRKYYKRHLEKAVGSIWDKGLGWPVSLPTFLDVRETGHPKPTARAPSSSQ